MRHLDLWFMGQEIYIRLILIAVIALAMALLAWKKKLLTGSGILAAVLVCFIVTYIGGLSGFLVMLFFFLSAGALSAMMAPLASGVEKKGSQRDWVQVLANSVPSVIGLIIYRFSPLGEAGLICFAAGIAEATADTWASEIGLLSKKDPLSIITLTRVPKGISGGVSLAGTLAAFGGALSIAVLFTGCFGVSLWAVSVVAGAGFIGAIIDSVLGATVQVQYRNRWGKLTEKETEDGERNERARGIPHFDNDMVNFVSGLNAALIGLMLWLLM